MRHQLLESLVQHLHRRFLDLAEALATVRSKGHRCGLDDERVVYLLDLWRRRDDIRELRQVSPSQHRRQLDEPTSLEEIIELLHLHKALCFLRTLLLTSRPPWIQPVQ